MKTFFPQFYFELLKLVARKRTYTGFVVFILAELIILWILGLKSTQHRFALVFTHSGYPFDEYYSGLTVAFLLLSFTTFFLGTTYLALVAGDMVAKEVEDGTLRMVLCRPVSRLRILLVKYLACVVYAMVLMIFIVLSCLAAGIAQRGLGGMLALSQSEHLLAFHEQPEALARFAEAAVVLCLSAPTLASVGFMFSCFRLKPATATVLTLSLFFMDSVLRQIPFFSHLKNYFITQHTSIWIHVFEAHVRWGHVGKTLLLLATCDAVCFALGAAYFCRRDFKS